LETPGYEKKSGPAGRHNRPNGPAEPSPGLRPQADALGGKGLISACELGETAPSRKSLERIAREVGVSYSFAESLLTLFAAFRRARESGQAAAEPLALAGRLAETLTTATILGLTPALMEIPILRET
jgi:hypothetical protein